MAEPVHFEERRSRSGTLAMGTFACPHCDAPVAPGPTGISPAAWVACPYCDHTAFAREFLSLAAPSRPARVRVTVR